LRGGRAIVYNAHRELDVIIGKLLPAIEMMAASALVRRMTTLSLTA
jgi:hypothetical protein